MKHRLSPFLTLCSMSVATLLGCSAESGDPRTVGGGGGGGTGPGAGGLGNVPGQAGRPAGGGAPGGFSGAATFGGGPPSSSGGSATCVPGATKATAGLIDNMEDGDNAIGLAPPFAGYWYVYNDGTSTSQMPPKDVGGANPFYGKAPGSAMSPKFAACTSGSGFTQWGAGIGFNLMDIAGKACPIDASGVTGLKFQAKGTGSVRLQVSSAPTATPMNGGTCAAATGCDYHANETLMLNASTWTEVTVPFAMLEPGVTAFDARTMLAIQFQAYGSPVPAFDFCIDDLAFY